MTKSGQIQVIIQMMTQFVLIIAVLLILVSFLATENFVVSVSVFFIWKLKSGCFAKEKFHDLRIEHWATAILCEFLLLTIEKYSKDINITHLAELNGLFYDVLLSFRKSNNPFLIIF